MDRSRPLLFVGDDWAEDHHDIELQDQSGRVLARAKLPVGVAGMARLHAMIGEHLDEDDEADAFIGIETDRGPWVQALIAAGYTVYPINPLRVARFRERYHVSGAKSDTADAHVLADMVRTERHQLRPAASDSPESEAVKIVARAHKTLIWERTRHLLRLRHALLEFFPAALVAFDDLGAAEALELLATAPDPVSAAALSVEAIEAALKRAGRYRRRARAQAIASALRAEHLGQPAVVASAYAATVRAQTAILTGHQRPGRRHGRAGRRPFFQAPGR
jgi:transposase